MMLLHTRLVRGGSRSITWVEVFTWVGGITETKSTVMLNAHPHSHLPHPTPPTPILPTRIPLIPIPSTPIPPTPKVHDALQSLHQLHASATTLHDSLQHSLAQEASLLHAQQLLQGGLDALHDAEASRAAQAEARWEEAARIAQHVAEAQQQHGQVQRYGFACVCVCVCVLCLWIVAGGD